MIQVPFLYTPKERKPGIQEVQRVVHPLFGDIALHGACEQPGSDVDGKKKTDWPRDEEQRKKILQFTANVISAEWPQVMIPVQRVESLMQEPPNHALSKGKPTVQNIAMEKVFDEGPDNATHGEKCNGGPGVLCGKSESKHENHVQRIEGREWVETRAS